MQDYLPKQNILTDSDVYTFVQYYKHSEGCLSKRLSHHFWCRTIKYEPHILPYYLSYDGCHCEDDLCNADGVDGPLVEVPLVVILVGSLAVLLVYRILVTGSTTVIYRQGSASP